MVVFVLMLFDVLPQKIPSHRLAILALVSEKTAYSTVSQKNVHSTLRFVLYGDTECGSGS